MKIGKLIFKKEYVLYYLRPETPIWFYDEPFGNKKNLIERIKILKKENAKTSVSTRFTIEI